MKAGRLVLLILSRRTTLPTFVAGFKSNGVAPR